MNIINIIVERLLKIGKIPICNGISSRAFHIGEFCFLLCYRCTFVVLFFFISLFVTNKLKKTYPTVLMVAIMIPMVIDGGLQKFFGILSTNMRRSLTGALFGIGMGYWIGQLNRWIDERS